MIDILPPFYDGRYRARLKLNKNSALRSERIAKRGNQNQRSRREKGMAQKGRVGCMFHLEECLGHSRKPRCLRYLFFTSGKEAFFIVDNAN